MKQTLTCFCGASMSIDTGALPYVAMAADAKILPAEYLAIMRALWWQSHAACFKADDEIEALKAEIAVLKARLK